MEQQITTKSKAYRSSRKITFVLIIAAVIILLISIITLIVIPRHRANNCSGLIGTWHYSGTEYSDEYTYIFHQDGTGQYITPDTTINFDYIDNIESFFILSPDGASYTDYAYQISDDNTSLTIIDSLGSPVPYSCS